MPLLSTSREMRRREALQWIYWAVMHKNAPLMCGMTVDDYRRGAELARRRAETCAHGTPSLRRDRVIVEFARRAKNNVGMVLALDTLGYNTPREAAEELQDEIEALEDAASAN